MDDIFRTNGDEVAVLSPSRSTTDLFINDRAFRRDVPGWVWRYELGRYPDIQKWLGYRDRGRWPDIPLSVQDSEHLRSMVQRPAAVMRIYPSLDNLYESACQDCFSAEDLGL